MNITAIFLFVTVGLLVASWLVYDALVIAYLKPRDGTPTITEEVRRIVRKHVVVGVAIGLVVGFLLGHFFPF